MTHTKRIDTDWLLAIMGETVAQAVAYLQTLPPEAELLLENTIEREDPGYDDYVINESWLEISMTEDEARARRIAELEQEVRAREHNAANSRQIAEASEAWRAAAITEAKAELAALYAGEQA